MHWAAPEQCKPSAHNCLALHKSTAMGRIAVEGMHFHAYHGYYERERIEGNHFIIDVYLDTDFALAAQTDRIDGTVNYELVYEQVALVMQEKYLLLEHVANVVTQHLTDRFRQQLTYLKVRVTKLNPPMQGAVDRVYIELERTF